MKSSTKRWWYTPPNKGDLFFVHIRETFQTFFKCKHSWYHKTNVCHGEVHGLNKTRRHCKICGEEQYLVYYRYGNLRTEWKTFARL